MKLKQLQELLKINKNDIYGQMKILGEDISNLSVSQMEYIFKKEMDISIEPKYKKWFKKDFRLFKISADIENLNGGEYSYFKQLMGDIQSKIIDDEGNIVEMASDKKINKLFDSAHKILSIFLIEKTFWKKKLSFLEKQNMILDSEVNDIMPIVFFLLTKIENLQKNTTIYYLNQMTKYQNEEA